MKKLLLLSLFSLVAIHSNAQVATLEHTYQTKNFSNGEESSYSYVTESGINYVTYNNIDMTLNIYDDSHAFVKTINLPISSASITKIIATDHLFNLNDDVELLICFEDDSDQQIILVDENGTLLQNFGFYNYTFIERYNETYKLILVKENYDGGPSEVAIFSLAGTLSLNQQNILSRTVMFPNPTSNRLNVVRQRALGQNELLKIFDVSGKEVMQIPVAGSSTDINVDVSGLSAGVYTYKLGNETKKFLKK